MKCCGKCYLKKQLNKVGDCPAKGAPNKIEKDEIAVYIVTPRLTITPFSSPSISIQNPVGQNLYGLTVPLLIFHPPSAVC